MPRKQQSEKQLAEKKLAKSSLPDPKKMPGEPCATYEAGTPSGARYLATADLIPPGDPRITEAR